MPAKYVCSFWLRCFFGSSNWDCLQTTRADWQHEPRAPNAPNLFLRHIGDSGAQWRTQGPELSLSPWVQEPLTWRFSGSERRTSQWISWRCGWRYDAHSDVSSAVPVRWKTPSAASIGRPRGAAAELGAFLFLSHFPQIFPHIFPHFSPIFSPIVAPLGIGFPCWPATSRDTIPRCISAIRKRSSLDRWVPNMEMCSKQRQSLIASFWQNIYIYIYIYLFIYWFKMIQSATHVRKWLCDIRENSLKAPRFIYGLSKPCMFVFRFRGLSLWSTSLGERHSSMQGKYMKVPCAPMCIFVWPCGRKPRCFSTFFCQARRNARLCPQKIRRLWISKQSKQDIHKISLNFIGNSFLRNILHESHGWFINFKDTHRRAKALSFFDLPCGAIFSMRSNCMTSMILQKLCNMICKNHIHCINTDQSWSLSHCFQSDSFIVVILCQNGWSNVVFNDDEMEYPRSNSYNNFFWAPEGQYFAPWFNLVQHGSMRVTSGDHLATGRGLCRRGSRRLAVWRHDQRQQDPWRSKIML